LLDNVYWEGYRDNNKSWTYTTPLTYPYYCSTTKNSITLEPTVKENKIK